MKQGRLLLLAAPLLVCACLEGGQFRHGLGRGESLKARLSGTPQVRIGRATLAIEVKDAVPQPASGMAVQPASGNTPPPDPTVPATQIQAALDRIFRDSFTIVHSNGEVSLRVAVTHYTPAESRIDALTQKMRVTAPPNPDGSPQLDPQTGGPLTIEKAVAVEQWTGRGSIAVRVEVVDSSGVLLDGFAPQATVRAAPQVISADGQDRVDRTQIPTHEQIRAKLIAELAAQFAPRYVPAAAEVEVPLAVDEELRPGNKLAKDGDFQAAIQSWQAASLKKPEEGEADRIHNLGAIYEVEGYDRLLKQGDPEQVRQYFQRAREHYAQAIEKDSKEKYFTRAADRVRKALLAVTAMQELEQKRQRALASRAAPSGWPPGTPQPSLAGAVAQTGPPVDPNAGTQGQNTQAGGGIATQLLSGANGGASAKSTASPNSGVSGASAAAAGAADAAAQEALQVVLNDARPDSGQEVVFREFARLRLQSAPALTDELKQQLESTGTLAYGVTALQAKRVVFQEARDWAALQPKLGVYRDSFAAFAQDGKISAEERVALRTLAKNLGMTAAGVQSIESAFKVEEK